MSTCYTVEAYVELDIEKIVDAILKEYSDCSIEDINMDLVYEYVNDHVTFLNKRWDGKGIYEVGDGPSLQGFEERSYEEIENELKRIKEERRAQ